MINDVRVNILNMRYANNKQGRHHDEKVLFIIGYIYGGFESETDHYICCSFAWYDAKRAGNERVDGKPADYVSCIMHGAFCSLRNALRDRLGLERSIFTALLLITGATALRGSADSVAILVISALIGGIGISLAGPLLSGFIKKYFPTKPGIVSIYSASMTFGAAMASAL